MIEISLRKALNLAKGASVLEADFNLQPEIAYTLYGASGAGKTSIFRMLSGLMKPDCGRITVNGTIWYDSEEKINLKPQQRNVGFMFQDYALFPNMSVRENLNFALKKGQNKSIIDHLMEIIELNELQHRNPQELSGGQQQRVALARALVNKPELVLLDEPLAALDKTMRLTLQRYITKVQQEFGFTLLLISHDVGEILRVSQQLFELKDGQLQPPREPASFFTGNAVSGKFQFEAEIINSSKEGILFILDLLVGNRLIKVVVPPEVVADLQPGDQVIVASKGFNPLIYKI
ncbi:ATP-binding cassette domain-containing protein [Flavimarina sp. Hel_I_48]|uniref:ATP-binding cassette domain-containing protein n=1 Tax=Flavimarina sp. Hel_I_48 TaxID=1392488 RepID=UPI0004DF394C|nr:ATP-binding cassette domain-containing protein [Flavimarina sp. Hel_I_48]